MFGIERDRDVSRLEGFSDAVFAFAATLLVVSLEVPSSFADLIAQLTGFFAFAITFAALVTIWTIHKAFFRRFALTDGWTVFLNCALLFVVLFYVFPLKFLTESFFSGVLGIGHTVITLESYQELQQLFMLYSAGFGAIFLCVTLMYVHAGRRLKTLESNTESAWEAGMLARHYLLFVLVSLLSILIAWIGWGLHFGLPGLAYFLLGPLCYIQMALSEKRRPESP
jgi:uncharacterized membrane protein